MRARGPKFGCVIFRTTQHGLSEDAVTQALNETLQSIDALQVLKNEPDPTVENRGEDGAEDREDHTVDNTVEGTVEDKVAGDLVGNLAVMVLPPPASETTSCDIAQYSNLEFCPSADFDESVDYILLVEAGVVVRADMLRWFSAAAESDRWVDIIYSDSLARSGSDAASDARGDDTTNSVVPVLRPGFSPARIEQQMYLGEAVAVSARMLRASKQFDSLEARSQRTSEAELKEVTTVDAVVSGLISRVVSSLITSAKAVAHVPEILYVSSMTYDDAHRTERVVPTPLWAGETTPKVSIVIPTRGTPFDAPKSSNYRRVELNEETSGRSEVVSAVIAAAREIHRTYAAAAVASVASKATDFDYEVVAVLTPGHSPALVGELESAATDRRIRFVVDDRRFNFSSAVNRGAVVADGDVIVFLNDDILVLSDDWLEKLAFYATRPEVGAVGAKLYYPDGRIQHAGIWSRGAFPTHRYEGYAPGASGYRQALEVNQNCIAVTGACLAVEKRKFFEVGGFSPIFPSSYNDVDLCLKLKRNGYLSMVEMSTELIHFESASRDPSISSDEMKLLHDRWLSVLMNDPWDNPNHVAPMSEELPLPKDLVDLAEQIPVHAMKALQLDADDPVDAGRIRCVSADASFGYRQHDSRPGDRCNTQ